MKAKVGEMEEEVKEGFTRQLMKEFTGLLEVVIGKKSFFEIFQCGF